MIAERRNLCTGPLLALLTFGGLVGACSRDSNESFSRLRERPIDVDWISRAAETHFFRRGAPGCAKFSPDGRQLYYLQTVGEQHLGALLRLDLALGSVATVVTTERLLSGKREVLSDEELARRERMRQRTRGIAGFELSPDGGFAVVPLSGGLYRVALHGEAEIEKLNVPADPGPLTPRIAPNGEFVAYVRGSGLYIYEFSSRREWRVASARDAGTRVGRAEFVAQEEMGRRQGFWWAPDSRRIVYQRTDERAVAVVHRGSFTDASVVQQRYPRPGQANALVSLESVSVWAGAATQIKWDAHAYPYLVSVSWSKDNPLTLVVQDREQHELVVLEANEAGQARELHRETDEAWLNLDRGMPRRLPDGRFLWSTERDGEWELELRAASGGLERVLVPRAMGYRGVVGVDAAEVVVNLGRDPTRQSVARVSLETGQSEVLTVVDGFSFGLATGANGGVFLRSESLQTWPTYRVLSLLGDRIVPSRAVDPGLRPTTRILSLEGERAYFAAVTLPRERSRDEKFPGIFHLYAGPTANTVEQRASKYLFDQWLADSGFVVFSIDVRGTPRRGRDWQRAIDHDFYSVQLEDQVEAVRLLSEQVPELAPSRLGLYGWSFGGYASLMSVLRAPDTYHAAVAGAPVVDWADYDTHYTERYLGVPEDPRGDEAYRVSNVLSYAAKLDRPLLLLHGTHDDNVFFEHSLGLSDALTRLGRPHRIVPLKDQTHRIHDPELRASVLIEVVRFLRESLMIDNVLSEN